MRIAPVSRLPSVLHRTEHCWGDYEIRQICFGDTALGFALYHRGFPILSGANAGYRFTGTARIVPERSPAGPQHGHSRCYNTVEAALRAAVAHSMRGLDPRLDWAKIASDRLREALGSHVDSLVAG